MRIKHNPYVQPVTSSEVSDSYQVEVDKATDKLSRRYARVARRLASARASLSVAKTGPRVRELSRLVEDRIRELAEIEALMRASPQSASHRGTKSFRPVPPPGGNL